MQFDRIPKYYNSLMEGVPYKYWVSYIEACLAKYSASPKSVLDVCCGTGTVLGIMKQKGYECCGLDLSQGMIEEARRAFPDIDFYVQNAACFSVPKKFDLAVSLFDSLNYILKNEDLENTFKRVNYHLNEGGWFIFDVNTEYALANDLFAQVNLDPLANPQYIWEPVWDSKTKICKVSMTFIINENGEKTEIKETHIERAYSLSELSDMLDRAGLEVLNIFHAYRFTEPDDRSDRVFYVCRKK